MFSRNAAVLPLCAAALPFVAMGCDGPSGQASAPEADVPLTVVAEEVFELGGAAAPEWQQFVEVRDAQFDRVGNLVLVDERPNRIVVVDPVGGFLRTVSRVGDGPGELRLVSGVGVLRDNRLIVNDVGRSAFLLFDENGRFVDQYSFGEPPSVPQSLDDRLEAGGAFVSSFETPIVVGALPDARLLLKRMTSRTLAVHALGQGVSEIHRAYRPSGDGAQGDGGLANPAAGVEGILSLVDSRLEFGPPLVAAVLADGRTAIADSVGYRVKLLRDDGAVDAVLERPIDPIPVTPEMREVARRRQEGGTGAVRVITIRPGMSTAEGEAESARLAEALASGMRFASEVPVVADVAVDSEDRIWVSRNGDDGVSRGPTDVFAADGDYLGTLAAEEFRVPDAFGPDGLMVYVDVGDLDVPSVRVLRLTSLEAADGRVGAAQGR